VRVGLEKEIKKTVEYFRASLKRTRQRIHRWELRVDFDEGSSAVTPMKAPHDVCVAERQLPHTRTLLSGCNAKWPEKSRPTF
jgi:hypothetical protein